MTDVKLGGATVQRIEKSYEPNFDAKMFFPDRKPEVVQQHRGWLIPNHYGEASNSLKLSGSARKNRLAALEHCAGSGARLMPCHSARRSPAASTTREAASCRASTLKTRRSATRRGQR